MIFQVSGTGRFPIDMLRHDRCTPASECDSGVLTRTYTRSHHGRANGEVVVNLFKPGSRKVEGPTEARWKSFGWTVAPEGQEAPYSC